MNKVLAVLFVLAASSVSAAPFVMDSALLREGSQKLSVLHHVGYLEGEERSATTTSSRRLRFVFLVPKFNHLSELRDGFGSLHLGGTLKEHRFTRFDDAEHLLELLGLSDCKTWFGAVVTLWNRTAGNVLHKVHARADGKEHFLSNLGDLADFFHSRAHRLDFEQLVKKGLVSHELVLRLHSKFGLTL